MNTICYPTFNEVYVALVHKLEKNGIVSTNRKGAKLTELFDEKFTITLPKQCGAVCRSLSLNYLTDEFAFYMSGSDLLEDAVKCSSFWNNCSDNVVTINSNYGKLLLHDRNEQGNTQFEHALRCLINNKSSKKAVMTLYNDSHAYISNDNPCTMYLKARIDSTNRLHLTACMRSSDIYFGLPYDVPFFIFIQQALVSILASKYPKISLGTYTHFANSLHTYERDAKKLALVKNCSGKFMETKHFNEVYRGLVEKYTKELTNMVFEEDPTLVLAKRNAFMDAAWKASETSKCFKKHVGCCMTYKDKGVETLLVTGYGGAVVECDHCYRDDDNFIYYGDECPSVHAEMRCLETLRKNGTIVDFSKVNVYLTHNSCDACAKLLDLVGIKQVYYDKPYKIDESHWPNITFTQIGEK